MDKNELKKHPILAVEGDSIAEELGIEPGDMLLAINGKTVQDALDYHLMVQEEELVLEIEKKDTAEIWELEIEKDEEEDLGLEFDTNLMDDYKSCRNKCVFCFIDQLPEGMRETLYFKDDDARLSFLQGNYITLTNMSDRDVDRIIKYHLSPINLSIHTMNMALRKEMLNNRFADRLAGYMDRLNDAGITMNGQIVLCKGLNDGRELADSIQKMMAYRPHLQSVSVVPVGLSKHRDGLYPLEPFTKADAETVLETIESFQKAAMKDGDSHFIHAGDEFYFLAERAVPEEERYDGYLQLENGVGSTRLFINTVEDAYANTGGHGKHRKCTLVTGKLMEQALKQVVHIMNDKFPGVEAAVEGVENSFFGPMITVSGLLTGKDIIRQLENKDLGDCVFVPDSLLKSGETVLLDDITLEDMESALGVTVVPVDQYGADFVDRIFNFS